MADDRMFKYSSFAMALLALFVVLHYGLLPGALAALAAFALTRLLRGSRLFAPLGAKAAGLAAALVIIVPLAALAFGGVEITHHAAAIARSDISRTEHLVDVAADWRARLPAVVAGHVPEDRAELAEWLGSKIQSYAPFLAGVGATWAHGLLIAVVGIIVGALAAATGVAPAAGPLAREVRARASVLYQSFLQIVVAQFWIAAINTGLTTLFLFGALPIFDLHIPYSGWLVLLTFVAGMLPIVGNLLCNAVLTIAGLQVGPHVALACLTFLIAIHKLEFLINAKVVGARISAPAWELVVAIFVFQAVFGVAGFVAAPLFFAYVKSEMKGFGWV